MVMFSLTDALSILMIPSAGETNSADFWLGKGNELCNSGQMEEAIKAYEHALSLDAALIDAWNNRGTVLANLGRFDEAQKCFDEAAQTLAPACPGSEQQGHGPGTAEEVS